MKYDKPLLAAIIGAASTIPYEIITRILVYSKIAKYSVFELNSLMITLSRPNAILGAFTTMIFSSGIALIFYYSLKILGWDYLEVKAAASSLLIWLFSEVLFMWLIEGRGFVPYRPINDYYSELLGAVAFGITVGLLFKKYLLRYYIPEDRQ